MRFSTSDAVILHCTFCFFFSSWRGDETGFDNGDPCSAPPCKHVCLHGGAEQGPPLSNPDSSPRQLEKKKVQSKITASLVENRIHGVVWDELQGG